MSKSVESTTTSATEKNNVYVMGEEEFWTELKNDYYREIAQSDGSDVYPSLNPGYAKEDGSINFECHCVGHLVGSPCGFEFREAIVCQKEGKDGDCDKQMIAFAECVNRTECFKQVIKEEK